MNGRVYDPLLGRFGTPDPTTESPFSTQGWNRYSYVGNSPLNFTDPSGYCFAGCFWQGPFKALGGLLRRIPILGNILTAAAGAFCTPFGLGPVCATLASAAVTGLASGKLGLALKAGFISAATAFAMFEVGQVTGHSPEFGSPDYVANIAGHAAVGCASSVASGGKCGPGALSAAVGAAATPVVNDVFPHPKTDVNDLAGGTAAEFVVGGVASVAGGGKFGNGAVTAAFGYLFNAYQGRFHDQLRDDIVAVYKLQGWNVATEVTLKMLYDGVWYDMRADIVYTIPGETGYGVVEVKTGDDPRLSMSQSYILPGIANQEVVSIYGGYDGNHGVTALGFQDGQLLPQGKGYATIFYQQDDTSQSYQTYLRPGAGPYPMPLRWQAPGSIR